MRMKINLSTISLAVILIGVFLATFQFFYNRSLWHDEAALARNLVGMDLLRLLKPLKHEQSAPIGFLIVEKLALGLFGKNEYALRLFPLLSFFVSIPLFYLFLTRLLVGRTVASISTAIFSINRNLLDYATEVKQYSVDVVWTLMIGYLSLTLKWRNRSALWAYAAVVFWVKNRKYGYLYLCLFPIGTHLILSGLKIYPFAEKFLLYAAPLMIFVFTSGLVVLFEFAKKQSPGCPAWP
ncbi:MAG: hypothetical protein SCM96_07310 [Acidobacteriota bacterium]|nr:hypothetical protein [Acidobacteriota bacterium]